MKIIKAWITLMVIATVALGVYLYSGSYNVGALAHHSSFATWVVRYARDRSVAVRADDLKAPDLSKPQAVANGAVDYAKMCSGCHLAPGVDKTVMSQNLYPPPANLARGVGIGAAREFWIIKHGLNMTGMPAWGNTLSDEQIWNIVAFLRQMPQMDPRRYTAMANGETVPPLKPKQVNQKVPAEAGSTSKAEKAVIEPKHKAKADQVAPSSSAPAKK